VGPVPRESALVTETQLRKLFPGAKDATVKAFAAKSKALFKEFGLSDKAIRKEYFLAQIAHETGGLTRSVENLNYSAQRLTEIWPTRFATLVSAQPYAANPEKLANFVYANRMGNGPPESGDGYRYRGRGYIQITGKDGYRQTGLRAGIDLVAKPERAIETDYALRVACAFWKWKELNPLCDQRKFEEVTKRINGGLIGYNDRLEWLEKVRKALN
jgi:putative chitinase